MRKGFRKAAALLSAFVMSLGTASAVSADVFAAESVVNGDVAGAFEEEQVTGDCTWTLDNGVLTVSGNGAMADYDWDEPAPWASEDVRKIVIEQGVTVIGSHAFYCCFNDEIIVADSVVEIRDYAFAFTNITKIDLPQSVTSMGENAFCYCTKLERITVPGKVSSMGSAAFVDCTGLKYAAFLEGVKEIPSRTFYGCKSLKNVTIPDGVESIGPSAFYGCTAMNKITVPESIRTIGETAIGYFQSSERWNEKLDGMTIYGQKGSAAESYADENGFAFVSTDDAQIGDVNFDGIISVADVTAIQKHIAELDTFTDAQLDPADTNGDGEVNINDATQIQKYIAELIDHLG